MSKKVLSENEVLTTVVDSVNKLANCVGSTMGPKGRNVLIGPKDGTPTITKDGVTVANFYESSDPSERPFVSVLKQAAAQTNVTAGDGTTTSTILTRGIINNSYRYLLAGCSPTELKKGMKKATDDIVSKIKESSSPIETLDLVNDIATISANDKTIGSLISTAVASVGKDGSISIEEGRSMKTTLELLEGFRMPSGYAAGAFVTDERRSLLKYEEPLILVTDENITKVEQILPLLEKIARENRPLLIVAESVREQALAALIMNTVRGTMKVAALNPPFFGEERRDSMRDLAAALGAKFFSKEAGDSIEEATLAQLGTCKTVESGKTWATFIDGAGENEVVEQRIDALKKSALEKSTAEAESIYRRISRLASGVGIIKVGAATEIEMKEKKHRIEDAIEAVKSAQEEGIVPGGGTALYRISSAMQVPDEMTQDEATGYKIILAAVKEPLKQLCANSDLSYDVVSAQLSQENAFEVGYNFYLEKIENLLEAGVVDPAKVTRVALENAFSVASTLLTTNFTIIEE